MPDRSPPPSACRERRAQPRKAVARPRTLGQQLLDIAVGETEPQVPAHGQDNHFGWEPEALETPKAVSVERWRERWSVIAHSRRSRLDATIPPPAMSGPLALSPRCELS